jgi:hypothetical protein
MKLSLRISMAQRLFAPGFHAGVAVQVRIVLMGEGGGGFGVVGQQCEEMFKALRLEFEVWRELPKDRPELFLEFQNSRSKEIRQWFFDLAQATDVGDEARRLDAENEVVGCFGVPLRIAFRPLQGVERSIDFDAVDRSRRELQFALLRQSLGVEVPAPRCVAPAGNTDVNRCHAALPSKVLVLPVSFDDCARLGKVSTVLRTVTSLRRRSKALPLTPTLSPRGGEGEGS